MINITKMADTLKRISLLLCIGVFLFAMFPLSFVAKAENSEGRNIMVSLGDSFSSGESIEPFYGQDEKKVSEKVKNHDWLAHRSKESWPGMLSLSGGDDTMSEKRGINWHFVAVSGAETEHLQGKQRKEYKKFVDPISGRSVPTAGSTPFVNVIEGYTDIDPQLQVFEQFKKDEVDYVTLTLGGNDAGFAKIIEEVALGRTYTYFFPSKLPDMLDEVREKIKKDGEIYNSLFKAYNDIAREAGPQAKIIVAGYPKLFEQSGKGAVVSKEEATLVNEAISEFNKVIENIVSQCKLSGMKICFVSVEEAFDGHEAYSKDPYINKIIIGTKSEDINDSELASAYSMHPNANGAKAYAKCVQDKIDALEKDAGQTEWPVRTTSEERDIVLVLDASGSMSGTPIEETKKASEKFVNTILKEDASIGIVTYDDNAMKISDFNINENYLVDAVKEINSGGGTNIESGLSAAYDMLQNSTAEKKIIVLMSDGEPNVGKVDEELIAYANSIKDEGVYIYTLGFFESLGSKLSAQALMEKIASDGCHYEVADASSLVFFFGDIADQINGQKYIYVRIACPVDVSVSYNGEVLSSIEDTLNMRTGFGSLTFEENESDTEDSNDSRVKILRLKESTDYDVRIEGTGRGRMNYTIGFMDENGEYGDFRKFTNIKISKSTVIDTVAANSNKTVLNVDEDGDGKYDLKYRATENGRGEIVDYTYIIYIALGIVAFIFVIVIFAKIRKHIKSNKKNN